MDEIIDQLERKHSWKDSMRKCCRTNKLSIELASTLTPLRFRAAYARFKAIYQRRSTEKAQRWLENELKSFQWLVLALSCISQTIIKNFKEKELQTLYGIFYFKQPLTLEYEVKKLAQDTSERQIWNPQQQALLTSIVLQTEDNNNKWNQLARKLYERSDRAFFKTGKQCRERWLNHLDPRKKRGQWCDQEDVELAKLFLTEGKKWSQISRKLGGHRTQHMVKNRYKTMINSLKKTYTDNRSENSLLRKFLRENHNIYYEVEVREDSVQREEMVKSEAHSQQNQVMKNEQVAENEVVQPVNSILKQEEQEQQQSGQSRESVQSRQSNKNVPQTTPAVQYMPQHQVYSPWVMGYQMTPTFSPFYVNVSNFSAFDASFNNQFYAPNRPEGGNEQQ